MGIILENHRYTDYTFNHKEGDKIVRTYEWKGIRGNIVDRKELTDDAFMALMQCSNDIQNGRLVIVKNDKNKDIIEYAETEEYKVNARTKDEVVKLLKGNADTLKKELSKITDKDELLFFVDVYKTEDIDSVSKQKIIAEALETDVNVLFNSVLEDE